LVPTGPSFENSERLIKNEKNYIDFSYIYDLVDCMYCYQFKKKLVYDKWLIFHYKIKSSQSISYILEFKIIVILISPYVFRKIKCTADQIVTAIKKGK
jgi:hypothetical protein